MNISEYEKLKNQVIEKYQKTVNAAERERDKGIEAINTVWGMLQQNSDPVKSILVEEMISTAVDSVIDPTNNSYGSLTSSVKEIIERLPKKFTKNAIIERLNRDVSEGSLDGCLRRLIKQKLIFVSERGSGRRPNWYSKVKKDDLYS